MPNSLENVPSRILIIDDTMLNVQVLSHLLRGLGEVRYANDGNEGLAMALAFQPHLILLDVEMPGMDGFEVCRRLKSNDDTASIAVIFVTSHNEPEDEVEALEVGAVDFITKPLNPPIVLRRVKTHLTIKHQADLLKNMATHDGLTGGHNRRFFDAQFVLECRRHARSKEPMAVLMIDIDFFKAYNDAYGHLQGDICLTDVMKVIEQCVKRPGEFAARYGGEEFVVLLPNTDRAAAESLSEQIQAAVSALKIPHKGSPLLDYVTVSVGGAALDGRFITTDNILELADHALYEAKKGGRNRVVMT